MPTSLLRRAYRRVRPQPVPPPPEEKLFFLHVPKCGGSSVDTALQQAYRAAGAPIAHLDAKASVRAAKAMSEEVEAYRERLLVYYMAGQFTRYISGHFNYSPAAWETFGDEWQYVSILREPTKRWISNYFYNKYKAKDHYRIEAPLEEFIETDRATSYGRSYVMNLAGGIGLEEAGSEAAIAQAIATLERFAVVGVLEHLNRFAADCQRRFGLPVEIQHRNRNPRGAGQQREELSAEVMARIEALCAPNLRVYDAVRTRIEQHGSWLR